MGLGFESVFLFEFFELVVSESGKIVNFDFYVSNIFLNSMFCGKNVYCLL